MRAVICGMFDPPTRAHVAMGQAAKRVFGDDCTVTYVLIDAHHFRKWRSNALEHVTPIRQRFRLLLEAVQSHGFEIAPIETDSAADGKVYNLIKQFGFEDTVLCLGIDVITRLPGWYQWQDLIRRTRLLVFDRDGYESNGEIEAILAKARRAAFTKLDRPLSAISSAQARRACREKDMAALKRLVPECVYDHLTDANGADFFWI